MSDLSLEIDLLYVSMEAIAVLSPRPCQILSPALELVYLLLLMLCWFLFGIRIALYGAYFISLPASPSWSVCRLPRLGLCFHLCACFVVACCLSCYCFSPLEPGRAFNSICVIDILSSKLVMAGPNSNTAIFLNLAWWLPPSTALHFIFRGGIQLEAET